MGKKIRTSLLKLALVRGEMENCAIEILGEDLYKELVEIRDVAIKVLSEAGYERPVYILKGGVVVKMERDGRYVKIERKPLDEVLWNYWPISHLSFDANYWIFDGREHEVHTPMEMAEMLRELRQWLLNLPEGAIDRRIRLSAIDAIDYKIRELSNHIVEEAKKEVEYKLEKLKDQIVKEVLNVLIYGDGKALREFVWFLDSHRNLLEELELDVREVIREEAEKLLKKGDEFVVESLKEKLDVLKELGIVLEP